MTELRDPFAGMRQVELGRVEQELEIMWREANAHIAATGAPGFARNSVLTLVLFTSSRTYAGQLLDVVHTLSSQHPSRAIIVAADPQDTGDAIQAQIGTFVSAETNSYGEDIMLTAQNNAVKHLPGVILPLVVSGLPSFLWWTGEPPWGTEMLESLVDGSDRMIVDIGEMSHVERSLGAMENLMLRKAARCAISDTSWTAQAPWRDLIAQFFDGAAVLPYLNAIERVSVDYAAGDEDASVNSGQAYLFAGWLASRLGWRNQQVHAGGMDSNRIHSLRDGNGHTVSLEVNARFGVHQRNWWDQEIYTAGLNQAADELVWVRPGALMSIYIAAQLNGKRATFTIAREQDLGHATTLCHVPDTVVPSQTIHLDSVGEREPISEQLRNLGHDNVYEEALSTAAQFVGTALRRGR